MCPDIDAIKDKFELAGAYSNLDRTSISIRVQRCFEGNEHCKQKGYNMNMQEVFDGILFNQYEISKSLNFDKFDNQEPTNVNFKLTNQFLLNANGYMDIKKTLSKNIIETRDSIWLNDLDPVKNQFYNVEQLT